MMQHVVPVQEKSLRIDHPDRLNAESTNQGTVFPRDSKHSCVPQPTFSCSVPDAHNVSKFVSASANKCTLASSFSSADYTAFKSRSRGSSISEGKS